MQAEAQMTAPAEWADLREFAEWYMSLGAPLLCPSDTEVYVSDDALTFPIYRNGRYQVELYVLHNPLAVPQHSHPFVEVIQSYMTERDGTRWSELSPTLVYPDMHGGEDFRKFCREDRPERKLLLTFERWPANVRPSTLAAVWQGDTVGPLQEALIRRFFPEAYVVPGYADITRSAL